MKRMILLLAALSSAHMALAVSTEYYQRKAQEASTKGDVVSAHNYHQMAEQEQQTQQALSGRPFVQPSSTVPAGGYSGGGAGPSSGGGTSPLVIGAAVLIGLWVVSKAG
jgi:hypothetical protein